MKDLGPISPEAPVFPTAGGALAPLKAKAEAMGNTDFSSLWSGQNNSGCKEVGAAELLRGLMKDLL